MQTEVLKENGPVIRRVKAGIKPGDNRRMEARVRHHTVSMDVSKDMGGDDSAPTPIEYLAMSLGGCVLNLAGIVAVEREIDPAGLEVTVSGELDLTRAVGLPTDNRAGFSGIEVMVGLQTDVSAEEKEAFLKNLIDRCPLCDTIQNKTQIVFRLTDQSERSKESQHEKDSQ